MVGAASRTVTDPEGPDREPSADVPTIGCERCGCEWDLDYELDELRVGNQAVEQFALDHRRHTGHFPDGVSTWLADCLHCPESSEYLREPAARRFAEAHARHTGHAVELAHASLADADVISR
jgi:hypothetical protein